MSQWEDDGARFGYDAELVAEELRKQPTPPPRCRVLVDGKLCGQTELGLCHPKKNGDPFGMHNFMPERRVSGERRTGKPSLKELGLDGWYERRKADRRKAGKL